jgi:hypothetical protein
MTPNSPTTTPAEPPAAMGLHRLAVWLGEPFTADLLRQRIRANPALRLLLVKVGRAYIAPAASLPRVRELLNGVKAA